MAIRRARQQRVQEHAVEADRTSLYSRWIHAGDLVFDIGANLGNRTRIFAELGAQVVAVEPQTHCCAALRWQFLFNRRVRVVGAAVSRDNSPQRLTQFDTDVLSSMKPEWIAAARQSGRFGQLKIIREIVVPCVTLDQMIIRHGRPTFTKIDVEGYEAEVLAGLSQPCGTISFEVTPEMFAVAEQCLQRLVSLGYSRFQISTAESMVIADPWLNAQALHANVAALAAEGMCFGDVYALAPGLDA